MAEDKKLHIAMFPWLAFGHLIPYLELSNLFAKKGHKISVISTPKNIDRLQKLPQNPVDFVKIPLPPIDGLPKNAEATIDVPYNKVKYLKLAYDGLKDPLSQFLQDSKPDWILCDFASYWLPPIASKLSISTAYFSIYTASIIGFAGPVEDLQGNEDARTKPEDFLVPPKWVPFETAVANKPYEILQIFNQAVTGDEENVSDIFRMVTTIEGSDILAIRSCYEFESEWFKVLEDIHHKPVIPVGLLPARKDESADENKDEAWIAMKEWLAKQTKGSVVYVAFGSETKPNQAELNEIALGLELSGLPFFWVLRTKRGAADPAVLELPEGFEERTKSRGLVCTSWAPQLKILSHDSVGGILTHSGWSSVVEAVQFEKVLILLPFVADQGMIARLLEEKKMGCLIARDDQDGSFTRDSVAQTLKLVMVEEEGKFYKDKIKEMKRLFSDLDRQDRYVDNLLGHLQATRKKI